MDSNDLQELRKSIVRTDKVFAGYPVQFTRDIVESINCYAYSMGIIYHGKKEIDFYPGFAIGKTWNVRKEDEIIQNVRADLRKIGIRHRQIALGKKPELKSNEYLVKLYLLPASIIVPEGDFHFIRQDKKTGRWFHKMGWYDQPDFVQEDDSEEPGVIVESANGKVYIYREVCYFAITEKAS